jgi:CRISPR-associated protein Csb2
MLAIAFTFPAGRYHATPWGRHVNEADVAWPPDLWRITRALIAVWHRKLDPQRFRYEDLQLLLASFAIAEAPSFRLPEIAIHTHTRHFMPGKGDKRTLVFDAFARIAKDDPIVMSWPNLTLADRQNELLDALLENLGFLGRAESWVEAQRVTEMPESNCVPTGEVMDAETGEISGEIVRLLAPAPPEAYWSMRRRKLAGANIELNASDMPPGNLRGDQKELATTLPRDWLQALSVETGELQAAGWSAPPGAVTVSYSRPMYALRTIAPKVSRQSRRSSIKTKLTTARYSLYGQPLPRVEDALRMGEAFRVAAMGRARQLLGSDALPKELSGHGLDDNNRHGHAFWLPEDENRDGLIDHLMIHVPDGLGGESIRVLTGLRFVKRSEGDTLRLMLEGIGSSEMFAAVSDYTQRSRIWRSVTPYLHPWHLKKPALRSRAAASAAIEEQIRREWALRGSTLPAVESIVQLTEIETGGRILRPLHFHRFRQKHGLTQPDTLGYLLELRFAEPIRGPLSLGFGCHFGLGLFSIRKGL